MISKSVACLKQLWSLLWVNSAAHQESLKSVHEIIGLPVSFPFCAGGEIQPGRVVGESDRHAEFPGTDPVTPDQVGTTML